MLESTGSYSDGQWHTVVANRLKQDGLVKVDGVTGNSDTIHYFPQIRLVMKLDWEMYKLFYCIVL